MWTVNLKDAKGDQSRERCGEERAAEEDGDTEAQLAARVEERKVEHHTSEEACFSCAKEKTNYKKTGEVLSGTLDQCKRAPHEHY